jgi:hypothetical protein
MKFSGRAFAQQTLFCSIPAPCRKEKQIPVMAKITINQIHK